MLELLQKPWPWYVAGPLIGLTVPALLLLGNKSFGISGNLRHICAACIPANIPFFTYNWKKEMWNIFFVAGILVGGIIATYLLGNPEQIVVHETLKSDLAQYGITNYESIVPKDLFSWPALFTIRGFIMIVIGGFMVGFGTRYAGGLYIGSFNHGAQHFAMAFIGSNMLLYGRRFYYGKSYSSIYPRPVTH